MRRVYRGELPLVARLELFRRGKSVTSVSSAQASWTSYRRSLGADAVLGELRRMAGPRGRCFYCSDSWGADVDHFVPIARQVGSTFSWRNMLWECPSCNRKKGRRFPTGPDGQPLMIDPTLVDPCLHLILDTSTWVLAPRFLSDGPDTKGNATLTVLDVINHEDIIEGRARSIRRLRDIAGDILQHGNGADKRLRLAREIYEDDFGVSSWFAFWEGANESPFSDVRSLYPGVWRRFVMMCQKRQAL